MGRRKLTGSVLSLCVCTGLGAKQTEPYIVVPVVRIVVVPVGNGAVGSIVVPAAAAFDTVRARGRSHARL